MSIKSLLLFLFLYVCLVWVGAALLNEGPDIRAFGLRWTAIGLIAVLAWIVIAWLWGWFRIFKARSAAKPKASTGPGPVMALHEDDAALLSLIQEAKVSLARGANAAVQNVSLAALPLYLLVGPEGTGKTSSFVNSSLEPTTLSGQPGGAGQATIPTRICNIWLAKGALFVEMSGRAFSADLSRWTSLLRVLRGGSQLKWWQRLYKEADPGLNLRGILAFGDVKEFIGASSPQGREKLERHSTLWRDRLGAISEAFGRQFPVYWITTKTDFVPYFGDYFARLRGPELGQIFGCTLPFASAVADTPESTSAQAENKRLTKSTSPLLHRLAERRVIHLAREDDPARKPGIYEFPREMRRIRPALIQFLVDVFRPHPLRHTPFLRGYYFSGTCEEEIGFGGAGRTALPDDSVTSDVSTIFRGDATQIFKSRDVGRAAQPSGRSSMARRWAFVPELMTGVVLRDNAIPRQAVVPTDNQRIDLYRKLACGAVCFVSIVLCLCFLRSWWGNSRLLESVNGASLSSSRTPNLNDLKALDQLHNQALLLSEYDRNGAPWRLRWGLYAGGDIVQPARDLYFRRFGDLLLRALNDSVTSKLKSLPATAGTEDNAYGPVSTLLKTHLMISTGAQCKPNGPYVARALKQTLDETNPSQSYEWRQLADRQIDFYAAELPAGNPVVVPQDTAAVQRAQGYLRSIQGADRLYAALLNEAGKHFANPQSLSSLAPDYRKVLNGGGEVQGVFTPEGWNYIKQQSKNFRGELPEDSCIAETKGVIANYQQNAALETGIQKLFARDYIAQWQKFVGGFSVSRYNGPSDAARKLEVLADHKSPLLALFALASRNTTFAAATPTPTPVDKGTSLIKDALGTAKKTLGVQKDATPDAKQMDATTEIGAAFQPVQWVVPSASDTWVTDKNTGYVDALAALGHSMDDIAHNTTNDPAVAQTATQNYNKAVDAARQLAERLSPNSGGLDGTVQRLLQEPIMQARTLIPTPVDPAQKANGEAHSFCISAAPTLRKFPFQPSTEDARLDEFARLFAPGTGSVWKLQADALAESVVKDGSQWKPKEGAKVQITQGWLNFLNRAQAVSDAFFPKGSNQPQLLFTLRPKLDPAYQSVILEIDGRPYEWKTSLQKQFSWPASPGGNGGGAVGRAVTAGVSIPFASEDGTWAVFRLMRDAEPRLPGARIVEWKYLRSGVGRSEALSVPVRLEFVEFPGGADVFNTKFFDGLQCGGKAAQQVQ